MTYADFAGTDSFVDACFASKYWHSGQWSSLYMQSCGMAHLWKAEDIEGMADEWEALIGECDEAEEYADTMREALRLYREGGSING